MGKAADPTKLPFPTGISAPSSLPVQILVQGVWGLFLQQKLFQLGVAPCELWRHVEVLALPGKEPL